MSESGPNPLENKNSREALKLEKISLAIELSKNLEGFPFGGILEESYAKLKETEQEENYPSRIPSIDSILERFKNEGIKVPLSEEEKTTGNIVFLPTGSNDDDDNLRPKHFEIYEGMDENLKRLILIDRELSAR
ncbi:MAG TPA: hypothetical protein PK950_02615 [Candidatus Paceibacterota bacterium]|nr:hypothetical protein [Candidatus Paceibacterota bacterium]